MAEIQWIKICPNLFDDEKIQLIEGMPEADSIIVIWFKLLCLAGKQNNGGVFMINDRMAYNEEMFATIFKRPLNVVRLAIDTFENFGMVEVINNTYTIANWEKHQNVDKMDEIREYNKLKKRESRAKKKLLESVNDNVNDMSMTCQPCQDIEEERDEEKESHSFILAKKTEDENTWEETTDEFGASSRLEYLRGSLGEGIVMMSDEQFGDLCEKLSVDELHKYIGIIKECELKGKKYKNKTHYQAILDMVKKDRGVVKSGS